MIDEIEKPARGNPNMNIKDYGFGGKYRSKEQDDEYRARAKGVSKWTRERCIIRLNDILDRLDTLLLETEKIAKDNPNKLKQESTRDLLTMMNKILDYMKYLYPPVTKNVNYNVDTTASEVIKRLKDWKKLENEKEIKDEGDNE